MTRVQIDMMNLVMRNNHNIDATSTIDATTLWLTIGGTVAFFALVAVVAWWLANR